MYFYYPVTNSLVFKICDLEKGFKMQIYNPDNEL